MACQSSLNSHLCSCPIADLANHNNIGVLTHQGADSRGKIKLDGRLNLTLIKGIDDHFDRIFDGTDIDAVGG